MGSFMLLEQSSTKITAGRLRASPETETCALVRAVGKTSTVGPLAARTTSGAAKTLPRRWTATVNSASWPPTDSPASAISTGLVSEVFKASPSG